MARLRIYAATDEVPDRIPAGCERISLVQHEATDGVLYQVERAAGDLYLCDADGDKILESGDRRVPPNFAGEWTLLRVLADVPADDPDAFFTAIQATAKGSEGTADAPAL